MDPTHDQHCLERSLTSELEERKRRVVYARCEVRTKYIYGHIYFGTHVTLNRPRADSLVCRLMQCLRLRFDCNSTALRPFDDLRTTSDEQSSNISRSAVELRLNNSCNRCFVRNITSPCSFDTLQTRRACNIVINWLFYQIDSVVTLVRKNQRRNFKFSPPSIQISAWLRPTSHPLHPPRSVKLSVRYAAYGSKWFVLFSHEVKSYKTSHCFALEHILMQRVYHVLQGRQRRSFVPGKNENYVYTFVQLSAIYKMEN